MKFFRYQLFFIGAILVFTSCRKKINVSQLSNNFGTIYGSGGVQELNGVLQTSDNGYILYGNTNASGHGSIDGFVMKLDEHYNLLWYKNYGGKWIDKINSMAIDDEGNMLAVGLSNSYGVSIDTGNKTYNDLFYLVYMTKNGEEIWDTTVQAAPKVKNQSCAANHVLFLENKTFAVVGTTLNFTNEPYPNLFWWSYDGYVFGINKKASLLWKTHIFKYPYPTDQYLQDERFPSAILNDKGDIITEMTTELYTAGNHNYFLTLDKVSKNGTLDTSNGVIWKTKDFYCLGTNDRTPMQLNDTGGIVFYNFVNNSLDFTGKSTSIVRSTKLTRKLAIVNIEKYTNQYILTSGTTNRNLYNGEPGWLKTDLQGNLLEEHFITNPDLKENLELKKVLISKDNEVLLFGILHRNSGSDILLLRCNQNGAIIK